MNKEQKKVVDKIIAVVFFVVFSPLVILRLITLGIDACLNYLFDRIFYPLYKKVCILVRKPIPNSSVHVKGNDDRYFKRVNEKLLTIKEAKALGKEYEEKGYEVKLSLSEF